MRQTAKLSTLSLDDRLQGYLVAILKTSVVVAIVIAAYLGEWGALLYCTLTLALMYLPDIISRRANIVLPIEFDLVLAVFVYASLFLGEVGDVYERFWWWDAALHISSGFIIAFIGFLVLYVKIQQKKIQGSPLLIGMIIFSLAMAIGAVWEIFEFTIDALFGANMQRGSLHDTMSDLIVDSLGALLMAIIGVRLIYYDKQGLIARLVHNFIAANPIFSSKRKK